MTKEDNMMVGVPMVPLTDEILRNNGITPGEDNVFTGAGSSKEVWTVNVHRNSPDTMYLLTLKWELQDKTVGYLEDYQIINTRTLQDVFRMMYVPVQINV